MKWSWQRRLIGMITVLGGIFWIYGGLYILTPSFIHSDDSLSLKLLSGTVEVALLLALVCLVVGLLGLRQRYTDALPKKGHSGFAFAFAGLLVISVSVVIKQMLRSTQSNLVLVDQSFGFGLIVMCTGLILVGSAALHHNQHKSWQVLPLVQGLLGLFLPVGGAIQGLPGFVVWVFFGLGWCWLGVIMAVEQRTQPVRTTLTALRP